MKFTLTPIMIQKGSQSSKRSAHIGIKYKLYLHSFNYNSHASWLNRLSYSNCNLLCEPLLHLQTAWEYFNNPVKSKYIFLILFINLSMKMKWKRSEMRVSLCKNISKQNFSFYLQQKSSISIGCWLYFPKKWQKI